MHFIQFIEVYEFVYYVCIFFKIIDMNIFKKFLAFVKELKTLDLSKPNHDIYD